MARVLIVVDEPDTLLRLGQALEAAGHRAILSADADTAITCLADRSVDLVILDVMMPIQDGWTVLEALASAPDGPPALVISDRVGTRDRHRATRLRCAGFLASPFTAAEVDRAMAVAVTLAAAPDTVH